MAIIANEICRVSSKRNSYASDSKAVQAFEQHFEQPVELKNTRMVKCIKFVKPEPVKQITIGYMAKKAAIGGCVIFIVGIMAMSFLGFLLGY